MTAALSARDPRLSFLIVTPSFNQAVFLPRTIASVFSQNVSPLTYIVMDGGSNDGTVDILKHAAAEHSGMSFSSERDAGQANAVNKAIAAGTGDIVGWLNSDDVYLPNTLEAVHAAFSEDPSLDAVYGEAWHLDADDRTLDRYPLADWTEARLKIGCCLCQPAVFFRRSLWLDLGGIDESLQFCMDYDFWIRAAKAGRKRRRLPQLLAGSRLHRDAKTISKRAAAHAEQNRMVRRHWGRTPSALLLDEAMIAAGADSTSGRPSLASLPRVLSAFRQSSRKWNEHPARPIRETLEFSAAMLGKSWRKLFSGGRGKQR